MDQPLINKPHINHIQKCLIEGGPNASCIEQTTDHILAFPRCMWARYNVYGQHQCSCTSCIENGMDVADQKTLLGSVGIGFCCAPAYIVLSLLAMPFALIGLPLKMCVLYTDDDAASYSDQIESIAPTNIDPNKQALNDLNDKILLMQNELNKTNNLLSDYGNYDIDDIDLILDRENANENDLQKSQIGMLKLRAEHLATELAKLRSQRTELELRMSDLI